MQINRNSLSPPRLFLSGTGSVGGPALPDFNADYVYSKKKSGISEREYTRQIIEQAYQDYGNGTFQNQSDGFVKLMKRYTSEVSPDRKGIITSGLKAVSQNDQKAVKPIDLIATVLEGKVKYQKQPSGQSDYIEFYDSSGEMVATYSNNGWTMYTTNAEAARQTNLCMIYNAAWRDAQNSASRQDYSFAELENAQRVFDIKA